MSTLHKQMEENNKIIDLGHTTCLVRLVVNYEQVDSNTHRYHRNVRFNHEVQNPMQIHLERDREYRRERGEFLLAS